MSTIFNGREFGREKERELIKLTKRLSDQGIVPKLISILVGEDPASKLYVGLKKKAAERIRCELLVVSYESNTKKQEIIQKIQKYNKDNTVYGIMVQLPLPPNFSKEDRDEILETIDNDKDVDGLKKESKFVTPVVKAVLYALEAGMKTISPLKARPCKVVVVGATGFEGSKIVKELEKDPRFEIVKAGSKTEDLKLKTKEADVIVSATGVADLIKGDMIKDNSVLIDVGSPKGDIEKSAYEKAGFVSPVPGGIGPMTISCLLENLVEAVKI